jgi:DNA-binding GntR family transcriptional regulator
VQIENNGGIVARMTKLKKRSLTEDTVRALRDAIFAGSYLSGQRLVEEDVADRLGVSRIVVREAFYHLKSQGLATGEHHRGKTVAALSVDDIAELIPLRLLMESLAATWAARRVTPAKGEALKKHVSKFRNNLKNYSAYVEIDFETHRAIWELSGNTQLATMLERLAGPMIGLASRVYAPLLGDLIKKEREAHEGSHSKIVDAICAGAPAEARHAMQIHILSFWKLWLNKFSGAEATDPSIAQRINDAVGLVDSLAGIMDLTAPAQRPAKKEEQ